MYKIKLLGVIINLLLYSFKIGFFECVEIEGIQIIGKKNNNGVISYYNLRYGVANRFQPPKLLRITEAAIMDEDKTTKMPKNYDLSVNKGSSCPQDCSDTQQTNQKTFLCRGTEPETQSESCLTLNIYTQSSQIDELLNQFSSVTKHVSSNNGIGFSSNSNNTQINMLSNMNNSFVNNFNKQKASISSMVQASILRPVYVFIHGGLYLFGSSNSETNYGEKLAESGAVIVTINYRLGIFGWLRAKNLSNGNMGFLDQRLALKWVKRYIEYFGGDPNKVILAGHSAGAKSVLCHSVNPESNIYFSGVIIHSGALSQNETTLKEAENMGEMAENLAGEKCLATILTCTTKQLIDIQKEVRAYVVKSNPSKALHSWSPIVDGIVIKNSCRDQALMGSIPNDMKVIISTTNAEGVQFFRSFIAYLPAISRGLATSNIAFRYLVSRIFGPRAGEAMKIYSNNNFSENNVKDISSDKIIALSENDEEKKTKDQDLTNNMYKQNIEAKYLEFKDIDKFNETNQLNETNQFVSSSGFSLFNVGRNRDDDKWNSILDDPVASAYARMIGDFLYSCPARMFIKRLSKYNPNVYGYYINSGHRWTESLKKGYEVTTSSFISDLFQMQRFSLRNTPKGIICQHDDIACKTYIFDCSDTRIVCHLEDIVWLFQTSPYKLNDNSDKLFATEQSLASKFFSHLINKSLGEPSTSSNKQILRKSFSVPNEVPSEILHWDSFSIGGMFNKSFQFFEFFSSNYFYIGKILKFDMNKTELVHDFKAEECELWEWRSPNLSMNFQQLIDSKSIPQPKSNTDNEGFSGIFNIDENENNLNMNLDSSDQKEIENFRLDQILSMNESNNTLSNENTTELSKVD